MRLIALLLVACFSACEQFTDGGDWKPPNFPPEASPRKFEYLTLSVGDSLVLMDVETLFLTDHPLTYTAASSDTTVATALVANNDRLQIRAVGPGKAEVSVTGTERPRNSDYPNGPLGRSATRTATVTVNEAAG